MIVYNILEDSIEAVGFVSSGKEIPHSSDLSGPGTTLVFQNCGTRAPLLSIC